MNLLLTKVRIIKAMVFPVVTYGCESWIVKKAERRRIDAFKTVVLEKTPESPLDSKESKPGSLKSTLSTRWQDWCWSWSSSILVIWREQPTHWKSPWCWERLRAEGEEGIRGWDGWVASPVQWTWTWANFGRWWGTGTRGLLQSMGSQRIWHDWLGNWTTMSHQHRYKC